MSTIEFFKRIFRVVDSKEKRQIYAVFFLTITNSLSESCTLFLIYPFIASLSSRKEMQSFGFKHEYFSLGFNELALVLVFAVITSGILRILYLRYMSVVAYGIGESLSKKLYESYLRSPYEEMYYLDKNSIVTIFLLKINLFVTSIILPIFTVISSIIMVTFILISTAYINPFVSLVTIVSLSFFYLIISVLVKKKLAQYGLDISVQTTNVAREIKDGLESSREITLSGADKIFLEKFVKINSRLRGALQSSYIIGATPRVVLETLGIGFVVIISTFYYSISDELILPFIGVIAVSTAKLLPLTQQIFKSWTLFKGAEASCNEIFNLLELQKQHETHYVNGKKLSFETEIRLCKISFKYRGVENYIFQDINLSIKKGSKVGLIGPSGSGKSTLLDIFAFMMKPTKGEIWIDRTQITHQNRASYYSLIGFVPQFIYLTEQSIAENIAFGKSPGEIDYKKIDKILSELKMKDFINSLPNGVLTKLDSGKIRVSGGQRQRIGIARVLYRETEIILFDEATNALDLEAHKAILEFVARTDKTVIIVSHDDIREYCDSIVTVSKSGIEVISV